MSHKKSTTKGQPRGKADSGGESAQDAALVRNILAHAFPTPEERDDARKGIFTRDSILDAVQELAYDGLSIHIYHPDILPHALPVILRAARAHVGRESGDWREVRALLAKLEAAARKGDTR
jgi:hypothetical protein